jgi:hypothetical protein
MLRGYLRYVIKNVAEKAVIILENYHVTKVISYHYRALRYFYDVIP